MILKYSKFYYFALPDEEKEVYKQLYFGFEKFERQIRLKSGNISIERIGLIAQYVYNDVPSFFYVAPSMFSYAPCKGGFFYIPKYLYTEAEKEMYEKRIKDGLEAFSKKYITASMTDYDKEKAIHDYLVTTVVYDNNAVSNPTKTVNEAFNILGALLKRTAVCWGISCAFKLMCDWCGIKSYVIFGCPAGSTEQQDPHAWNVVVLDGDYYHVDVTWDLKNKGDVSINYDYFNIDDKLMGLSHAWDRKFHPACKALAHNYYYKHKLYVKTVGEIAGYIRDRIKAGDDFITFKFANEQLDGDRILRQIESGVAIAGCPASMRISPVTHNVYVELRRTGKGNRTLGDGKGVFDGSNLPAFNPPKENNKKKTTFADVLGGVTEFFHELFH